MGSNLKKGGILCLHFLPLLIFLVCPRMFHPFWSVSSAYRFSLWHIATFAKPAYGLNLNVGGGSPSPYWWNMNGSDILFSTLSNLTGGLVADCQTLLIALVSLGFICMAVDILLGPMIRKVSDDSGYRDYKRKRLKQDIYRLRYEKEGNFTGGWDDKGKFRVDKWYLIYLNSEPVLV